MIGTWPHQVFDAATSSFTCARAAPPAISTAVSSHNTSSCNFIPAPLSSRPHPQCRAAMLAQDRVPSLAPALAVCQRHSQSVQAAAAFFTKPRNHLLADQLDRSHHLIMRDPASLQKEDHLVHSGRSPFLHHATNRVRIAPDRHAVLDQLLVAAAAELAHHRIDPAGGGKAHRVERAVIVAVVPASGCAGDVAARAVILVAARECKAPDLLVRCTRR